MIVEFIASSLLSPEADIIHACSTIQWFFTPDILEEGAYLAEMITLPPLRQQIEAAITGSSPTMQNITKTSLLAPRLPVPTAAEQRTLVKALTESREQAARLRAQTDNVSKRTAAEVEGMVMGPMQPWQHDR